MKALKGQMPRIFADHRTTLAKQLRVIYDDLGRHYRLEDGVSRRVAVLTARAWLEYQAVGGELTARVPQRGKGQAIASLTRLRRRQTAYAGQFLGGLRQLESLCAGNGHHKGGLDLAAELARQELGP